jgi:hypothetical protein
LILGDLGVVLAADELEVIESDPQEGKQQKDEALNDPKPATEVLRGVFEFHKNRS